MLPDETGRYCNSCKKSVIDFTIKSDEEIQQFFIGNFKQPVCGRFKNTQVQRIVIDLPQNIFSIQMPLWMQFLVGCLLIFGISIFPFETAVAGKIPAATAFYQGEPIKVTQVKTPRILKKKKRRKYKIISATLIPYHEGSWEVYGFMVIKQDIPIDEPFLHISSKVNRISVSQMNLNDKSLPHKEQPGPTPFMPTEFILPSILLIRKENNNQSMD